SAGPVFATNEMPKSTFDLLVGSQNQFQTIEWFLPDSENEFHIQLKTETGLPFWMKTGLKAFGLLAALVLLYRFRTIVSRSLTSLQGNPVIRLLLLGAVWLLFFQPISIGLLLIVFAFILQLSKESDSVVILKTSEI
ncbi:hypothetical protein OAF42_04720, partial [Planctomicrobium sp.]